MANKHYIHNQKILHKEIESMVPAVYATIALVLYEGGLTHEDIEYVCARSQELWDENIYDINHMLIDCYNKTGMQFMTPKQMEWAKKKGLINE